jgi:hypothetical protein
MLGFKVGKAATFLKNAAPDGQRTADQPKMANGAIFCLNWHTKGHSWSHCENLASHTEPNESKVSDLCKFIDESLERVG